MIRVTCFIGIGSNLDAPIVRVRKAIVALGEIEHCRLMSASSLYCSAPIGPQNQPDFINAVACIETVLEPLALLRALQQQEQHAGRQHLRHWGERTLDLDLLLYGNQRLETPELSVPHKEMTNRAFVLLPMAEIAPDLILPDGRILSSLLPAVAHQSIHRLTAD